MKTNNGIIVVNKESGYTSRDVVNIISKKLGTKKVGHTGTLDPLAKGVLVVLFGKYTKLVNILTSLTKIYEAEIKLGIETDTLDITGNIIKTEPFNLKKEDIISVLNSFKGLYHMEVPAYSAIKVNGKKLYDYARNNLSVTLPFKDVEIYDIEFLDFQNDIIKFRVKVAKGTYIRSLIRDICHKLNTIGTMSNLIRISQGDFNLKDAYTLKEIQNDNYKVLNIRDVLPLKELELPEDLATKVKNGNIINLSEEAEYILFISNDEDIALYKKNKNNYECLILF